jgi:hypothetical protein
MIKKSFRSILPNPVSMLRAEGQARPQQQNRDGLSPFVLCKDKTEFIRQQTGQVCSYKLNSFVGDMVQIAQVIGIARIHGGEVATFAPFDFAIPGGNMAKASGRVGTRELQVPSEYGGDGQLVMAFSLVRSHCEPLLIVPRSIGLNGAPLLGGGHPLVNDISRISPEFVDTIPHEFYLTADDDKRTRVRKVEMQPAYALANLKAMFDMPGWEIGKFAGAGGTNMSMSPEIFKRVRTLMEKDLCEMGNLGWLEEYLTMAAKAMVGLPLASGGHATDFFPRTGRFGPGCRNIGIPADMVSEATEETFGLSSGEEVTVTDTHTEVTVTDTHTVTSAPAAAVNLLPARTPVSKGERRRMQKELERSAKAAKASKAVASVPQDPMAVLNTVEVAPAPVEPTPVEVAPAPVEPTPVEVAPVEVAPVEVAPVEVAAPTMKAAGDIPADEVEAAGEEEITYTVRQRGHRPGPTDVGVTFRVLQDNLFEAGSLEDMGTFEVMASSAPGKWLHPAMHGFEPGVTATA